MWGASVAISSDAVPAYRELYRVESAETTRLLGNCVAVNASELGGHGISLPWMNETIFSHGESKQINQIGTVWTARIWGSLSRCLKPVIHTGLAVG